MTGFRLVTVDEFQVLVNDGPSDSATGRITGESAAALWTRQVLTDGRLRAVVLNSSADDFVEVHRIAERVADELGLSAVDVAVWPADATSVTDADLPVDLPTDCPGSDTVLLACGRVRDAAVRPVTDAVVTS